MYNLLNLVTSLKFISIFNLNRLIGELFILSKRIFPSYLFNLLILLLVSSLILSQSVLAAQIRITWDPNTEPDLAGYKVYYGISSGIYEIPFYVGNVTTYTLTGLASGQTYFIAVTAYDATNESDYSNEISRTANDPEMVASPGALSGPISGLTGTSYTYTTGSSSSNLSQTVEYQFDWKGDGMDLSSWGSWAQAKIWTVAGTYQVRVRARCVTDTDIVSSWSSSLTVTITNSENVSTPGIP